MAVNRTEVPITEGDLVTVSLPAARTIGAAFLALIMPLLCFLLFFILSSPVLGLVSDGARVLAGTVGLALGFGVNLAVSRRPGLMPEIVERKGSGASEVIRGLPIGP